MIADPSIDFLEAAMTTEPIACTSWHEFKTKIIADQFPNGQFSRGRFLFRGQGAESWLLSSTFDRWYQAYGEERTHKVKVADQLLDGFMKESELEDTHLNPHPILWKIS